MTSDDLNMLLQDLVKKRKEAENKEEIDNKINELKRDLNMAKEVESELRLNELNEPSPPEIPAVLVTLMAEANERGFACSMHTHSICEFKKTFYGVNYKIRVELTYKDNDDEWKWKTTAFKNDVMMCSTVGVYKSDFMIFYVHTASIIKNYLSL